MSQTTSAVAPRSLFLRLVLGFALPAAAIWIALATWTIIEALGSAQQDVEEGLTQFSRQIIAVTELFRHEPERMAKAAKEVERIENNAKQRDNEEAPEAYGTVRIQIWIDGQLITEPSELPSVLPDALPVYQNLSEVAADGATWFGVVRVGENGVTVRVAAREPPRFSLLWPSVGIVVTPLLVCLPLLLIPAWFMTRKGLKPLGTLVDAIGQRALSGELTRLPRIQYRELQPVVTSMNRLLDRLESQLQRERAFVADVAHEMKTPLAVLRTNLDISRDSQDPSRIAVARRDLDIGLKRANHLIGQLLSMARLDADAVVGQTRWVDLAEFVRERVALFVPLADERGQALEVDVPESICGHFDIDAVGAVVDNLLDNAVKYAYPHSTIAVCLSGLGRPEHSEAHLEANHAIGFSVTDQGPGIAAEMVEQALVRFGRAGVQDMPGAGLGLSIVQRAARRLHGNLHLSVAPNGQGLCAEVEFSAEEQTSKK